MRRKLIGRFLAMGARGYAISLLTLAVTIVVCRPVLAACACGKTWPHLRCARMHGMAYTPGPGDISNTDFGGTWYWVRSPEQERRVTMSLFSRYCIRCHGVDGRGVWDIPDVPDFTNTVWQATRPEAYRARVILEGRGAVMPAFRGTITLEEACALARYLNTFVPGTEVSRPDVSAGAPAPLAPAPVAPPFVPTPESAPGTPGPTGTSIPAPRSR
jgi:hypothetical protein